MFITLEADYAVRIVSVLCRTRNKMDAKTISNDATVTLRFALKILRKLVASGLVKSFKGTQGGYIIAKEPSEITLRMVIECIEGTYYFSRCLSPDGICNRGLSGACCYQRAFNEISQTVRDKLEEYTFADLIGNSEKFKPKETTNETQQEVQA
ncbi:Rrf2 family transcriptional regulator [Ruminococcus sp.]|uniref:RrF2 family transcriptional regulator n=1 Tax=Ruminococcus sp. TaxID=41978 RepID=UPI0025E8A221|nr:Rrf2 family transcriptional regulator [Ruminococcus sp.]